MLETIENRMMIELDRPKQTAAVVLLTLCSLSCGAGFSADPTASPTSSAQRPNVILIMTDDQGYGDMSCHGNPTIDTPNLDALHSQSIRFTDFHVAPFCTPTRAALMTGRYPARTGAYRTSSGRTGLHSREKTLGDLFTANGYATGMFGKWHLGDNAPSRPMDCGFEKTVWHRCGGVTQISDHWSNDYFDDTYLVGDQWRSFQGYCTDVWFDEAMSFISSVLADAGGSKPFFVYLPTNAPHGPYLVAPKWKQPFLDAGRPKTQAAFQGMVANFDWNLGRLLQFLREEKLDSNTLVVFLTDNGTSAGCVFGKGGRITGWPANPEENAGMRGGKSSAYDGGHRVPLFIRFPDRQHGLPRDIETLAMHFDLTPTLMEICKLDRPESWPQLDGRSLVPLLQDSESNDSGNWEPRVLHTQMHGGNGYVKPGDPWLIGAAMTERWRLVEGRELYDIRSDPAQKHDVANQFPDVVRRLTADHLKWFASVRPGMSPTPVLLGSDLENPTDLTSQDWAVSPGNPPWSHGHVVRRSIANGSWHVEVARAGRYRFTLSRWPLYLDRSIDSVEARIQVGQQRDSLQINDPDEQNSVAFEFDVPAGKTKLQTWLTTPEGKEHGAYFVTVERLRGDNLTPSILWSQYGIDGGKLKLAVHTDASPLRPTASKVQLQWKVDGQWQDHSESIIEPLTAMATFRVRMEETFRGDVFQDREYRVTCGGSSLEGVIRKEPIDSATIKMMAVACINDKWFPYAEAVSQMLQQDPDLVFFAGDQIYESNAGGEVVEAHSASEVPAAMENYLAKWRRFGLTFRDLLKDRPSIMITDDHDVYANDLWGNGGRRMDGDRTTGGYPMHPDWVNAVEKTQMWHLPDAVNPGPWGDGILAYFSELEYGGVHFAILEDRKFKSPPSEVLKEAIPDPLSDRPNRTLEVIMDPDFDVRRLDREDLQLLGRAQETFLGGWAEKVVRRKQLSAVLSQSPLVNIGNYDVRYGDMDSNGWPQSARNRALAIIAPTQAVMVSGDIHFGTLHQHGIQRWGDGPWGYSLPAFSSKQNRRWGPPVAAQGNAIPGRDGTGNHHDRFGNKLTVAATAPGVNGYGMIVFDKQNSTITCEIHTMDAERVPSGEAVPGWPHQIGVVW